MREESAAVTATSAGVCVWMRETGKREASTARVDLGNRVCAAAAQILEIMCKDHMREGENLTLSLPASLDGRAEETSAKVK